MVYLDHEVVAADPTHCEKDIAYTGEVSLKCRKNSCFSRDCAQEEMFKPAADDGVKDGALAVATVMSCTLSVDHRAVDGAIGAEYLGAFKTLIEDPLNMLL